MPDLRICLKLRLWMIMAGSDQSFVYIFHRTIINNKSFASTMRMRSKIGKDQHMTQAKSPFDHTVKTCNQTLVCYPSCTTSNFKRQRLQDSPTNVPAKHISVDRNRVIPQ